MVVIKQNKFRQQRVPVVLLITLPMDNRGLKARQMHAAAHNIQHYQNTATAGVIVHVAGEP